jgi:UPF0755 protein
MKKRRARALLLITMLTIGMFSYQAYTKLYEQIYVPHDKTIFKVYTNENLRAVSMRLEDEGVIQSARLLRLYLSWKGYDTKLLQGEFHFPTPVSIKEIGDELIQKPDKPLAIVTIPEGSSDEEVVTYFTKKNEKLSKEKMLNLLQERKVTGYLFPDTYFLTGIESENELLDKMLVNFKEKYSVRFLSQNETIDALLNDNEVRRHLVIASILEGEANTEYDMRVITDILERRESLGMKLQVDAAKSTYEIKGFPEMPINNPGLMSLRAVKNPIHTDYLYYVTGKDGKMHYAKTFKEHRRNIKLYL